MNDKLKRPGETAKTLDISGMTLRNYVKHFEKYLSPDATKPTGRKFSTEDIETLKFASDLLRKGNTYSQVSEQLQQRQITGEDIDNIPPEPEPDPDQPPEETSTALVTLEFFNNVLTQLHEDHQTAIDAKDAHISELQQDKERLQKRLEWLETPWFVRMFRNPPK